MARFQISRILNFGPIKERYEIFDGKIFAIFVQDFVPIRTALRLGLRIFPSFPGSRLTIFYRDAGSAILGFVLAAFDLT